MKELKVLLIVLTLTIATTICKTEKPKILIIGDSISIGYTSEGV